MAEGYYPEFYLKKRQRERVYSWIWTGAKFLAVIVVGLLGALVFYRTVILPRNAGSGATEKQASERGELRTQQRLDDLNRTSAQNSAAAVQEPAAKAPDLDGIEYSRSLPDVNVSVEAGSLEGAAVTGNTPAPPDDNNAVMGPDAGGPAAGASGGDTSGTAGSQPAPKEIPSAAKPETVKPKEQPKQEKPVEKPKTEKPKAQEKPAETKPVEKPKADSGDSAAAKSGPESFSFNVYAGGYLTREAAESHKGDLSTVGMSGSVQEKGGKFLLYIGSVSDIDEANALKSKLQKNGFDMAFVTRKSKH